MNNIYETEKLLAEYLLFHYGNPNDLLTWEFGPKNALNYPARIVQHFSPSPKATALDLGCAVGRSTYELTRTTQHVLGIDYSHSFIETARHLATTRQALIPRLEEAHQTSQVRVHLPTTITHPERAHFQQADAMNLTPSILHQGPFDRILAANLLCRLPKPETLLKQLPQLTKPHGELLLATPCTWLEEFTPKPNWPLPNTADWLKHHLTPHFNLTRETNEPFLIRESARKYQWTVAYVTRWQRNPAPHPTNT